MLLKPMLDIAVPAITFGILLTVGCGLRPADFQRVAGSLPIVFAGLVLPLLLLPALALLLIAVFRPPAEITTGLLLVALCPIGGFSNFWSHLARASAALSVVLTGLSCLLAALTIPLLSALIEHIARQPLGLTAPLPLLIGQILIMLVLPISLGMLLRARWPDFVNANRGRLQVASLFALATLLALIIGADFQRFLALLANTSSLAATFVVASFAIGTLVGIVFRASANDRFTLAAEFATRNVAVAATIAVTLLHRVEFATFGTVYVLIEAPILLALVVAHRARNQAAVR